MLKYHIQTVELTSAQASISFNSIPQDFTDLYVLMSLRGARANNGDGFVIRLNNTLLTRRYLYGEGASVVSGTADFDLITSSANSTANTFGNASAYIANYSSSTSFKSVSMDGVSESNQTTSYQNIAAGLYSSNSPVTTIEVTPITTLSWLAGSSISLYGVRRGSDGVVNYPATGGTITTSGGYTIHTFNSSGTLTTAIPLEVEYLVIAGGGGGGGEASGGGGAGGYRSSVVSEGSGGGASAEAKLSLISGTIYTVTVGAGGAGAAGSNTRGTNGVNSTFSTITSTGGGGGGSYDALSGNSGGSGGGGDYAGGSGRNGAGTANQGFAGGGAGSGGTGSDFAGGGGGGAGEAGGTDGFRFGGDGLSSSITGTATFRAGGGSGGGGTALAVADGGLGGGGVGARRNVSAATPGTANTGAGGGGGDAPSTVSPTSGGTGGSGVVIIRYLTP
jgi:hypothetical protein